MLSIQELEEIYNKAEQADETFYKWLENQPIPETTIARELGYTYQQFRYKARKRQFTKIDKLMIITTINSLTRL